MEDEWNDGDGWGETSQWSAATERGPEEEPPRIEVDLWVAHDEPERPIAYGVWLCDCGACALALKAAAVRAPRLPIVLKTGSDRLVVTAEYADQVWSTMGSLEPLCYVRRDYIREVFVAGDDWMWWMPSDRWWSLTRSREVTSSRRGLRCATRSRRWHGFSDVEHPRVPRHLVPGWVPSDDDDAL